MANKSQNVTLSDIFYAGKKKNPDKEGFVVQLPQKMGDPLFAIVCTKKELDKIMRLSLNKNK